jgi:hypothetical protein
MLNLNIDVEHEVDADHQSGRHVRLPAREGSDRTPVR